MPLLDYICPLYLFKSDRYQLLYRFTFSQLNPEEYKVVCVDVAYR